MTSRDLAAEDFGHQLEVSVELLTKYTLAADHPRVVEIKGSPTQRLRRLREALQA